jgi:hypothetical protein
MAGDMKPREYSTRARGPGATETIGDVLAAVARLGADGHGHLLAPPTLQSWPGVVHGGGLVALLDIAARALGREDGPRRIEARLTSPVPIGTPLGLEGHTEGVRATVTIVGRAQPLTSATIDTGALEEGTVEPGWSAAGREGWPMPRSDQCLACGALNPLGLRFDTDCVWARFLPREIWRRPGDGLDPALSAVLLDEVAWWLGALTAKEGGLTNRISLALLRPDAPASGPITAVGRFADVTPVDRRRSFWRTRSALLADDGLLLATAVIVFRAGAEYSTRQMSYFRSRTDPGVFARMFPGYGGSRR